MKFKNMGMIACMEDYGGSFIKALAFALAHADIVNYRELEKAFPGYFKEYSGIAKAREERRKKNEA